MGKPGQSWPDSGGGFPEGANKYSVYASATSGRTPVVYVGANDGFLHGFRASDGNEVLAYAPSTLFRTSISAGYHRLTDPNFNHNNLYVDGTPTVSDAFLQAPVLRPRPGTQFLPALLVAEVAACLRWT